LLNDTVKNNILFGRNYDSKRYHEILDICQLKQDLCLLPLGDLTVVGERGINLSGGQK
jgi:ABC-type multidrug transport system fused ATPase/permease subunit